MKMTIHLQFFSAAVVVGSIFCVRSMNMSPIPAERSSVIMSTVHVIPLAQVISTPVPHIISLQTHQDPFVAQIDDDAAAAPQQTPAATSIRTADLSATQAMATILHGVVIGTHSYALLKDGDEERVLSVGDRLGSAKITAITIHGVDLSDGVHLHASNQSS